MTPETRYAKSGDVHIAYQVTGSGPFDLVLVAGFVSNLDTAWELPALAHCFNRLGSFCRLIRFDKRGTGLSDRVSDLPTLEQRMDDVRAVMDAAGSERAALFGVSEGGPMSALFAATYPGRTKALVLCGSYGHFASSVMTEEQLRAFEQTVDKNWGTGVSLPRFAPSAADDPVFRAWFAKFERTGASPAAVVALMRMNLQIDIRHVLPAIRVPTLVMHRAGDVRVSVTAGREIARQIPGAKYVELPGADHLYWAGDPEPILAETEEFLTGVRPVEEVDRVLATVMFTDIVDSTKRAEQLGDREWRNILARHNDAVGRELARFRGRQVKSLGDGVLATFDGPARALRCAAAIAQAVRALGLEIRAGLHTGEIEFAGDDVSGIAVNIAARVAALAGPSQVLASSMVGDLAGGSGLRFTEFGTHQLKGLREPVRILSLASS